MSLPKSRTVVSITSAMLASVFVLVALLFTGCATARPQMHGDVAIEHPTALITGPAVGHWAEQDEHAVIAYTVSGTDCTQLSAQRNEPSFVTHGTFALAAGETFCVIQLRDKQRVLFHAERP